MWPFSKEKKKKTKTFTKGGVNVSLGDSIVYTYITGETSYVHEPTYGMIQTRAIFTYEFPVKRGVVTGIGDGYVEIDRVKHPSKELLEVGHIKIFLSEPPEK